MSRELLIFEIDDCVFGVPAEHVRQVLRAAALFPLLEYPKLVEGGLNLRGEIIPVIDGRAILSRPHKPIEPSDHMIVIGARQKLVAIHIDRALELARLEARTDTAEPPPGKLIERIVNTWRGATAILDVDGLLAACAPVDSPLLAGGSEA